MDDRREPFLTALRQALGRWELPLGEAELELMWRHYVAMVEHNRVVNLTRIVDPRAAAIKHYADSLALLTWSREGIEPGKGADPISALDIGTGAGFPSVPLAIARPSWRVTAIDGTGKKAAFVSRAAEELELRNLRVEHVHATQWRTAQRFDLVVARAIGPLADYLPCAARFATRGGHVVAYQSGARPPGKVEGAVEGAAPRETVRLEQVHRYELPDADGPIHRALHVFAPRIS